jgi:hypothetical protein
MKNLITRLIVKIFLVTPWYETFIEIFPSIHNFIDILKNNKDNVNTETIEMWT